MSAGSVDDDPELAAAVDAITGRRDRPRYGRVRFLVLRLLGLVYAFAFLGAAAQLPALVGPRGLLPADAALARAVAAHGSVGAAFFERPTIFLLIGASDRALVGVAAIGVALGVGVAFGLTNALVMLALWCLQLSIVHVGQVFYGYGWEILLLEAGFLAIFLCPLRSFRPVPRAEAPAAVIWLLRWLAFRVMFGAGLIKLRGDPCWRELTCLAHHYETQPIPNPLSPLFHAMPLWAHQAGVLVNHGVELVAPFLLFGPRPVRAVGGAAIVAFQLTLILSGNLSFLNWLTIAVAVAAFDDRLLARVLPSAATASPRPPGRGRRAVDVGLVALVVILSVDPALNLLSVDQRMNSSFDRLHLVNTYGAFGSVNRERYEVVIEGTLDDPTDPDARWREYELPCKPGDPARAPCWHAPYQDRLDWQMWFAAFRSLEHEPWIAHLLYQELTGRGLGPSLFAHDPFGERSPRAVRASHWRYRFARSDEPGWWVREWVGDYVVPVTADDPRLLGIVRARGWPE